MTRSVTFKGNPVSLQGAELAVGDTAPAFRLQASAAKGLGDITLDEYKGKVLILSVAPSLDTGVCAMQTKKFNAKAAAAPDNVRVLTVTMDLPFAQSRFCGAENIDKLDTASDHRDASFGQAYGLLIDGGPLDRILARAVFVIGADGRIKHLEVVPEITTEPNYDAALAAAA